MGFLGAHHYYLGNFGKAMSYTLTFGWLGFGWLADVCTLARLVQDANEAILFTQRNEERGFRVSGTAAITHIAATCFHPIPRCEV